MTDKARPPSGNGAFFTDDLLAEAYRQGASVRALCGCTGYSRHRMRMLLREAGVGLEEVEVSDPAAQGPPASPGGSRRPSPLRRLVRRLVERLPQRGRRDRQAPPA